MEYYQKNIKEVLKNLNTSEKGLSQKEAAQRLKINGKNKIEDTKKQSKLKKFLNQFKDLMILLLFLASIFSFVVSKINKEPYTDTIVILLIVILNAIIGYMQEEKADKAIQSLSKMKTDQIRVKRNNKIYQVKSEDLVKGDIIILEAGDIIPADSRIINQNALKVDESALTGESMQIEKTSKTITKEKDLSERTNMLYKGTAITYGKAIAVICETGKDTEFGKIAETLKQDKNEITPLQKKVNEISKFLSTIIIGIIFIILIIGIIKNMPRTETIMLAISLAVAAIPEGLPAVITIILSLGAKELANKKAIVRNMTSIEALGTVEVICTDKTGTITQNKMKAEIIYYDKEIYKDKTLEKTNPLLKMMILNSDVEKTEQTYIGDPTEVALFKYCESKINIDEERKNHKRVSEIPFDSDRKMMSTINKYNDDLYLLTKGSFDSIIKRCTKVYEKEKDKKLTEKKLKELKEIEKSLSSQGYRMLAFAYKKLETKEQEEKDLVFIGLVGIIDPPRKEVKEIIKECNESGIKTVLITGDSYETSKKIAKDVGILKKDSEIVLGSYLEDKTDEELKELVKEKTVYARATPMTKLKIVNAWKQNNKIVAMTGDGVNDAPAIKFADIGIGMGITGTEVSKSVSDIVLADDSFPTIVKAIKEGRRIFDNIRNILVYLLTGNIAEVLVVLLGMIYGIEIFLPIQLLYINLITDSIPAIALAFEKEKDNILKEKNRKSDKAFFTPFIISKIAISSFIKTFAVLTVFLVSIKIFSQETAVTMTFLSLILIEIIYAFSCRNLKENVINKKIFQNKKLNISIIMLILIQIIVFLTPIKHIFKIQTLSLIQVVFCITIVITIFTVEELSKTILKKLFKD